MAAFLTANRWSSGIGTHKTKEGRILCTGVGCLGCFPDKNQGQADELGVFDVDLNGHPFRPWLNDYYAVAKGKSTKKAHRNCAKNITEEDGFVGESFNQLSHEKDQEVDANLRSVGTQTEDKHDDADIVSNFAGFSKETQKVLYSMLRGQDFGKPDNQTHFGNSKICQDLQTRKLKLTIEHSNANRTHNHYNSLVNSVSRNVNKTARILDNLYLMSKKDTALNSHDNILPREEHISLENSPWDLGENAACLYFAIEYFNCERMLPDFKVLEIVEALSDVMPAKDIKCVQRVAGMWQIVLRQRRYLRHFRQMGLTIRGRVYQLVDDIDSYCNVVYSE